MADTKDTTPQPVDGWWYVEHDDTQGTARIPADDAVRERYEARGWRIVDPPADAAPFVPAHDHGQPLPAPAAAAVEGAEVDPATGASWVELVHPLDGQVEPARARFPADEVVVADQLAKGWVLPRKTDGDVPVPAKRAARKRAAAKAGDTTTDTAPDDDDASPADVAAQDPDAASAATVDSEQAATSADTKEG